MHKNIYDKWCSTKLKIDDIILPSNKDLYKRYVSYIKQLKCPPQHIADMLKDLANVIFTSYPEVKEYSSNL